MTDQNLKCIRAIDPMAADLLAQCSHAALYDYDVGTGQWTKTEVGGPFFVYARQDRPLYSLMIANRQALEDLICPLRADMRFELQSPYIFVNIPGSKWSTGFLVVLCSGLGEVG